MSLTSYRAAPPRDEHKPMVCASTSQQSCDGHCRSNDRSSLSPVRDAPKLVRCMPDIYYVLLFPLERRKAALGAALGYWPGAFGFVLRRLFSSPRQILLICALSIAFNRPGSDLLSRVLRRSTIGAGAFHGRVRNGNGCGRPAMTTRSIKGNVMRSWFFFKRIGIGE
jgi:hypothetical protein